MSEDLTRHGTQERILVVDDEEIVRAVTARLLNSLNYQVVEASDGPSALRKLAELDESNISVDLIFSDVVMPYGMNGIDLSIAVWGKYPKTPVILTSGYPATVLKDAGLGEEDLRQIKVLKKPYSRQQLSDVMADALAPETDGPSTSLQHVH